MSIKPFSPRFQTTVSMTPQGRVYDAGGFDSVGRCKPFESSFNRPDLVPRILLPKIPSSPRKAERINQSSTIRDFALASPYRATPRREGPWSSRELTREAAGVPQARTRRVAY